MPSGDPALLAEIEALYRARFADFVAVAASIVGERERAREAVQDAFASIVRTRPPVVQRGSADGVSVVVRGAEIDADFSGISTAKRRLLVFKDGRINVGCFKLVTVGGIRNASGTYVSTPSRPSSTSGPTAPNRRRSTAAPRRARMGIRGTTRTERTI